MPAEARYSAPVQTGCGAHPASCTVGTGSFPGVKSGRGVALTPHPLLVPWSRKSSAVPLLPLWAVRPLQSLRACTNVHFTLSFVTYLAFDKGGIFCHSEDLASWYILIIIPTRCTNWSRTLHVYKEIDIRHTVLLTACEQDQDGTDLVLQNQAISV